MAGGKQSINSFQEGMKQDVDILLSNNKSYRYSIGGRLMFNKNGTYSWEIENGNKLSFTVLPGGGTLTGNHYVPIGHTGNSNIRVIFSVDPIDGWSEIGLFSIDDDGVGVYKTLFNDFYDPNEDSLGFNPNNQIEARFLYENDGTIRVYWVDGVESTSNQPRVFTFKYDRTLGNTSDVDAYSAFTTTVHSMNVQAESTMGIIKYIRSIDGGILTGIYQYTYSLGTKDGYNTPWYPVTRSIFVTSDVVNDANWNTYEMEGSGTVTSKGNRIEIKGIDQKFDSIRVAYIYSETEDVNDHASIFSQVDITGASMEFDHVANDGEPLLLGTIAAIFSGIRAAKTLNIKDSTLYYGNVMEGILVDYDTEVILAGLTVSPKFRDMRSDEKDFDFDGNGYEAISSPPVTNGVAFTGTTIKKQYGPGASGEESYVINADYTNYKGTQIDHSYEGYFRGETYRFALVFYDKLGFPSFAVHLCDMRFPDQSSANFTAQRITSADTVVNVAASGGVLPEAAWPTNNYGDYPSTPILNGENSGSGLYSHIRVMGLEVSGIDVSSISNSIAGFKIVRTELDASILTQGLAYPCVKETIRTRPAPFPFGGWADWSLGGNPTNLTAFEDVVLRNGEMDGVLQNTTSTGSTFQYAVRPYMTAFYMPDYDFDEDRLPIVQSQDRLRLVGGCHTYNPLFDTSSRLDTNTPTTIGGIAFSSFMQKMYYSKNTFHDAPAEPYPQYLDETDIVASWETGLGGQVNDYEPGLDLRNAVNAFDAPWTSDPAIVHRGYGKGKTIFYKTNNFENNNSKPKNASPYYQSTPLVPSLAYPNRNAGDYTGVWICNYTRPNANPYGGLTLSALERNIFYGTGHFQPIGNSSFAEAPGNIYNEIEVFGGDCFLDYFGFLRTYSNMTGAAGAPDYDYNMGVIFPWESKLNHTLRNAPSEQNPMYPDVGSRSQAEYDSPGISQFPNGLYWKIAGNELIEEFDFNPVLLYQELIQLYTPKPINFQDNTRFPVRWRYSLNKFYGDPVDTWRVFQVNDFHDLNGSYGEITSSLYIFNQIYSWQLSAFGRLRASDRALIESSNAGSLTTGVGDKLDGIDYISEIVGNQHQWSLFSSGKAAYWINVDMHSIMRFAQDGKVSLEENYGLVTFAHDTFGMFEDVDNPAWSSGIVGAFDFHNNDAVWSLVYDEYLYLDGNLEVLSIQENQGDTVYDNNETIFFSYTGIVGPTKGIYFPEGKSTIFRENYNTVYYVCSHSTSNVFSLFTRDADGVPTALTEVQPGECYRVRRDSNVSVWTAELIDKKYISPEPFSFSFNESLNVFQGFHAWKGNFLMSHKDSLLSQNLEVASGIPYKNEFWIHDHDYTKNSFYGVDYKSILTSVVAEAPMLSKTFDSLRVNVNKEGSEKMITFLMETETQSYYFDVQTDTRQKYLEDILRFPTRTKVQKDRTRGKHLKMTFEFLNNSFKSVRMTNLVTFFRNSNRI